MYNEQQTRFMFAALLEAEQALEHNDAPIGAVIVHKNRIIGKGHNQVELLKDPTAHAETIAISAACNFLQTNRLDECELYTTLEPCVMCSGAIMLSKIPTIYFGAFEPKFGAAGSLYNILQEGKYNHTPKVYSGLLETECKLVMQEFFRNLRNPLNKV